MLAEVPDQSQDVGGDGHLLGDAPTLARGYKQQRTLKHWSAVVAGT